MVLVVTNVVGRLPLPDGSNPTAGIVTFKLSGYDTDGATIVPSEVVANIDMATGEIDANLWPNSRGVRNTSYAVTVTLYMPTGKTTSYACPNIFVPESAAVDIATLFGIELPPDATATEFLAALASAVADAETAAASASVDAAAAAVSASDAALYDGVKVDTFAELAAVTPAQLPVGGYIRVIQNGFVYQRALDAAVDAHLDYSGGVGVKLYVRPDVRGFNVMAFGAVNDSVTDNTAIILAAALAAGPRGTIYIPPLVRYDYNALMDDATMPDEVVVFDDSLINGGYLKDKLSGIFEKGDSTAAADTTFVVSSGHNAGIALDNTGKSTSAGGLSRNVGLSWTGGRQAKGAIPGFPRPIAREEFNGSGTTWAKTLRKRAPWVAADADYFRWAVGTVVAGAGEYCFSNNKYYVSTGAGTTGATAPSHTTGSVSDGGVTWTYVQFSYDQAVRSINDYGRIAINSAIGSFFRRDRMSVDDTGTMAYSHEPVGASKTVKYSALPTDGSSVAQPSVSLNWAPASITFVDENAASTVGEFNANGLNMRGLTRVTTTAANADTTPTVAGTSSIILNNSAATSVTGLDDGVANQEVQIIGGTANTTLVNGAGFRLKGAVNAAIPLLGIITVRKTTLTASWVEVSRSF